MSCKILLCIIHAIIDPQVLFRSSSMISEFVKLYSHVLSISSKSLKMTFGNLNFSCFLYFELLQIFITYCDQNLTMIDLYENLLFQTDFCEVYPESFDYTDSSQSLGN